MLTSNLNTASVNLYFYLMSRNIKYNLNNISGNEVLYTDYVMIDASRKLIGKTLSER